MIDPFHLEAYGKTTVNYNRDIEIFPVLNAMFELIAGESPYKSPTDMGVNMAGNCIVDDEACRYASNMEIIRRYPSVTGVFHCYSGSAEMAREILDMGWYLGFTGAITFKNARKALEVIRMCPSDRILIETDCPYLAPVPLRGKRNDSRNLTYMAKTVAELKGISLAAAAEMTTENGRRFFGI